MSVEQLNNYLRKTNDPSKPEVLKAELAVSDMHTSTAYWVYVANQSDRRTQLFNDQYPTAIGIYNNLALVCTNGDSGSAMVCFQD